MAPATCVFLLLILCYTAVLSDKVELYPKRPLFRVGDRRELVCRMKDCSETMTYSWGCVEDRPLHAEPHSTLSESTLVFKNVQKNNENTIVCMATCQGKKMQSSVKLQVYSFPNDPVVSGHDSLVSGQENTLTCTVSDIYPAERITVEWLRKGKVIHTQEGEFGTKSLESYYTFKPQPNDTEEIITCRATLSLEGLPQEERIRETSVSMTVLSYSLEVFLHPNLDFIPVRRGSPVTLSCFSSGCPHAHITWQNVTHQAHMSEIDTLMSHLGPWTVGLEDNRTFICEVKCGSLVKSNRTKLRVFSFPSDPTIEISGPLLEGKLTNLTCTVHDVFPVDSFYMQWLYEDVELQSVRGNFSDKLQNLSLTIPIKPKDSDQNKTYTCKVKLEMEGLFIHKISSTTLAVHYPPKRTTIDVRPQTQNLIEGEIMTISCQTNSFPEGHVTLRKVVDEEEYEIASSNGTKSVFNIPFINVSHSGIYVCEAVNRYGRQRESVQITVQASPVNVSLTSKGVQEGETTTVCCHLVSLPPSDITLTKRDNGTDISTNETFLLVNVTANDSGLYQVNTTNVLVSNVISNKKDDWNLYPAVLKRIQSIDLIMPVVGLGALAIVISILNYIRRAKRKGFYELTEGIP